MEILYYNGYGVEKDYEKSSSFYIKACNSNIQSFRVAGCNKLLLIAADYYHGRGITQNKKRATEIAIALCLKELKLACKYLKSRQYY